jgi:hypothetical protein
VPQPQTKTLNCVEIVEARPHVSQHSGLAHHDVEMATDELQTQNRAQRPGGELDHDAHDVVGNAQQSTRPDALNHLHFG